MANNEKLLKTRMQQKHDIESNWNKATTFIPKQAEIIVYDIELDGDGNALTLPEGRTTPYTYERFKVGDGKTTVTNLPFYLENELEDVVNKINLLAGHMLDTNYENGVLHFTKGITLANL